MKVNYFLKLCFVGGIFSVFQSCIVSSRPNISYFNQPDFVQSNARFTSVNLPLFLAKPMIRKAFIEDKEEDMTEVKNLMRKISRVKILTVENSDAALMRKFATYLDENNYADWMTIRHHGENVNIRVQQNGDLIKKLLLTVKSDKDLVYIDIRGKFSIQDINNALKAVGR